MYVHLTLRQKNDLQRKRITSSYHEIIGLAGKSLSVIISTAGKHHAIWCASSDSVFRVDSRTEQVVWSSGVSQQIRTISSLAYDQARDKLFVGGISGLTVFSGATGREDTSVSQILPALHDVFVRSLTIEKDQLWIATNKGVWQVQLASKALDNIHFTEKDGLCSNSTYSIALSRRNGKTLWNVGTNQGLAIYDGTGWERIGEVDGDDNSGGIIDNLVYLTATSHHDTWLWCGTSLGISHHDGKGWINIETQPGTLDLSQILAMAPDKKGSVWIVRKGDAPIVLDADHFSSTPISELPANATSLTIENNGSIWMSLTTGLAHFTP